jgi:hypothetical protein
MFFTLARIACFDGFSSIIYGCQSNFFPLSFMVARVFVLGLLITDVRILRLLGYGYEGCEDTILPVHAPPYSHNSPYN